MRKTTLLGLWTLIAVLLADDGLAQWRDSSKPPRPNWLTGGIYWPISRKPFWASHTVALGISYHYQVNANLFSIRALWSGDLCITCEAAEASWDFSVLYGRSTRFDEFHASISGGLGLTGGEEIDGSQEKKLPTTVGVALQGQAFVPLTHFIGIGLYAFGNINKHDPFYGLTFNLQLGEFRQPE